MHFLCGKQFVVYPLLSLKYRLQTHSRGEQEMKNKLVLWASWVNADPRRIKMLTFALTMALGVIGVIGGGAHTNGMASGGSD
jgi:hypothetical protein